MDLQDLVVERGVHVAAGTSRAGRPPCIDPVVDTEHPAQHRHRVVRLLRLDELEDQLGRWPFSVAKKAERRAVKCDRDSGAQAVQYPGRTAFEPADCVVAGSGQRPNLARSPPLRRS